jgi:mRNA-capping enzyme
MQGYTDPYKPDTDLELLKWKFAHLNSVDFLLRSAPAGEMLPYAQCAPLESSHNDQVEMCES